MHRQNYQDILPLVQMPTRYAGSEINAIKKDLESMDLTIALMFPDLYEIGTSHFGLQILYSILNNCENIAAERFFTPAPDMEHLLRQRHIPSLSMESQMDLKDFDLIGISLLYELNFTNILTQLELSNIPFYAQDRGNDFPLIIGGGPCAFNPEPLADFFDAFVIGDGEESILQVSNQIIEFKSQGDGNKKTLLKLLSKIEGVYIPSFFKADYDDKGIQIITPLMDDYCSIRRAFLPGLTNENFPTSPIIPYAKPVHDRLRLEIARGCSRGCRFCQAGMIYRPVRERSLDDLIAITKESLSTTGYSDISLLSLSTGDYSNLSELMQQLLVLGQGNCNAISLPSIRAERLTPQLMNIIKKVRKTGFTIAPEAGSQRLRDIVNKNLSEQSIQATVENAFKLGWKNIKLYFMMGLPFEAMADIDAICNLSQHLAGHYAKGKAKINVSVAGFIPKAHTPFQRCSQISLAENIEKLQYLKDNLKHKRTNLKWQTPQMSLIEGVWARGDRRLSKLLVQAHENGCRLDGWTDKFDYDLWQDAFDKTGIDPKFYTSRERDENEILPWDHIDSGVSPKYLKKEFENAKEMALTLDCRDGDCTGCGICDFEKIKPVLYDSLSINDSGGLDTSGDDHKNLETNALEIADDFSAEAMPDEAFKKFELTFSKLGKARLFGHLELATIVQRAVKRAGFNVKYSKGFNPSMRLSFDNALPVGMESEEELLFIYLEKQMEPDHIRILLNQVLPEGLTITGCKPFNTNQQPEEPFSYYTIQFLAPCMDQKSIDQFLALSEFMVEDLSKKRKVRRTDLRKSVESLVKIDTQTIDMVLKKYEKRTVRPTEILTKYFKLDSEVIMTARIKKTKPD